MTRDAERKKKNRSLGLRRKRLQRRARLEAAVKWRVTYGGANLVRGYARWFGVDLACAMTELRMLGAGIGAEYERRVRQTLAARAEARARWRAARLVERTKAIVGSPADWPIEWISDDEVDVLENPF